MDANHIEQTIGALLSNNCCEMHLTVDQLPPRDSPLQRILQSFEDEMFSNSSNVLKEYFSIDIHLTKNYALDVLNHTSEAVFGDTEMSEIWEFSTLEGYVI